MGKSQKKDFMSQKIYIPWELMLFEKDTNLSKCDAKKEMC